METKHVKFSEKPTFGTPWYAHERIMRTRAYQGVRNVGFSENWRALFFETPVLRFAVLPYYRRSLRWIFSLVVTYKISKRELFINVTSQVIVKNKLEAYLWCSILIKKVLTLDVLWKLNFSLFQVSENYQTKKPALKFPCCKVLDL